MRGAASLAIACALLSILPGCWRAGTPVKVVVLGFDGAGWETLEPLIAQGKLPYLARLRDDAAWGPLATFKPTKSPVIWTSIATGKTMAKHGILDFVYLQRNRMQVPYENSERREPSLWQILDHFGKRSVVVNWFVTYPPDPIDGVMVSNRFRRALLLPPERRARMRDAVHPEERFEELLSFLDMSYERIREERALPDLAAAYARIHPEGSVENEPVLKDYRIYVLQEALVENVSRHLYQTEDFDFFASYFRLPDIVQHTALRLVESEERQARLEEISELLLPFYRYLERIVRSYLAAPGGENTYFVVLSDHGFALHPGGYDHYHIPESAEAPGGIFLLKGPGVKPGKTEAMSVYDVAPTILHLYGLPAGSDMDGRPATALLDLDREVRYQRYSRDLMKKLERRADEELDREIDQKTLEELKSLGYIR